MGQSKKEHLHELLESFDTAMLITKHGANGEGDHARPMAIAAVDGTSTIWFVTSTTSPKVKELKADSHVAITCQSDKKYVALSGVGTLVTDRAKIAELWKESWKIWFPDGKDSPDIGLVRVTVQDAEFWDNAGMNGVRYAFEALRAYVVGEKAKDSVEGQHGRVKSDGQPTSQRN